MSEFLISLAWFLLFTGGAIYLAYNRVSLLSSTATMGAILVAYLLYGDWHPLWALVLIIAFGALVVPNLLEFRREKITRPALDIYRTMLPSMSDGSSVSFGSGTSKAPPR